MNAGAIINKGKRLDRQKKHAEALKCYDTILVVDSRNTLALTHKAMSLERLKRTDEADACYREVIKIRPDDLYARCGRARIMSYDGRFDTALGILQKIDSAAPGAESAFKQKALIYYDTGMPMEALKYLWKAVRIRPKNPAVFFNMGMIYEKLGHVTYKKRPREMAIKCYDMAAKIDGEYAEAMFKKALLLYDARRPAEALAEYERMLRVVHGTARIYAEMACCLADMGQYGRAVAMCKKSLAKKPLNAAVWFNMGEFYFMMDKIEDALLAHDTAVRIDPKVPYAKEIHEMLVQRLTFKSEVRGT